MRLLLCTVAALAAAATAAAAEPIATDRPDFVESSAVVGTGRFQVETGLGFGRDREAGLRTRTLNTPTLLRFGTSATTELRLETEGYTRERVDGESNSTRGYGDVSLGLKWHSRDGDPDTLTPSAAWLLHVDLPTGTASLRGEHARPSLRAVAEWELPHDWSLGVMPGLKYDVDAAGRRFTSGIFAVTAGRDLYGVLHAFVEIAGQQLASRAHGGNIVTFDAGLTGRIGDDWQWDLSLQKGLSRPAPDLQLGVGLSARF